MKERFEEALDVFGDDEHAWTKLPGEILWRAVSVELLIS